MKDFVGISIDSWMTTLKQYKGYITAVVSACAFGFINLFSVPLLMAGYSPTLILMYRTGISAVGLAVVMQLLKISFRIKRNDIPFLVLGACLYFFSAWFLLLGYRYLHSGLATAIHFSYPIFVTLILSVVFKIIPNTRTTLALAMAIGGVLGISLCTPASDTGMDLAKGIPLILLSGLAYAIYIILLRYSRLSRFPGFRVTFYVMLANAFLFGGYSWLSSGEIVMLQGVYEWSNAILLAIIPTIVSNLALVHAVQSIGSAKSSILGAIEPVTALAIGIGVFGEPIAWGQIIGVLCILTSVFLVIFNTSGQTGASPVEHES